MFSCLNLNQLIVLFGKIGFKCRDVLYEIVYVGHQCGYYMVNYLNLLIYPRNAEQEGYLLKQFKTKQDLFEVLK